MHVHDPNSNASRMTVNERRDAYRLRILAALATTLALTLVCARLPFYEASQPVGWYLTHAAPLTLDVIETAEGPGAVYETDAPPQTRHTMDLPDEDLAESAGTDEPPRIAPLPPPQAVPGRALLADADIGSRIVGGMGAYYIHIDYPVEAIRANVQGRLLLHFTIGADGRAADINVAKSLHPLCDSAAVAALKETRFIPAREDGEPIPIRVQLPVRFRLEEPPAVAESAALRPE